MLMHEKSMCDPCIIIGHGCILNLRSVNWATTRQNLPLLFSTKRDSNQTSQLLRIARKLEFSFGIKLLANLGMTLSKMQKQRR